MQPSQIVAIALAFTFLFAPCEAKLQEDLATEKRGAHGNVVSDFTLTMLSQIVGGQCGIRRAAA
jgi:hypothetical protein